MNYVDTRKYELQERERMAAEMIGCYLNEQVPDEVRWILSAIVIPGREQCTIEGRRLAELIDAAAEDCIPLGAEPPTSDVRAHLMWGMRLHNRELLNGREIVQNMTTDFADLLYDLYRKS